jgi:hypothetical protein
MRARQFRILTAALTETAISSLIARKALVITMMVTIGYFIGLRKTRVAKNDEVEEGVDSRVNLKGLTYSFLPIIITIILPAVLNLNIAIETIAEVIIILIITKKPTMRALL